MSWRTILRRPGGPAPGAVRRLATGALAVVSLTLVGVSPPPAVAAVAAATDWPQFRQSAARTGSTGPSTITPANVATLAPAWHNSSGASASSPAVVAGTVYAGSADGNLYAFAAGGGPGCTPATSCPPLWKAALGGQIEASPAVAGGVVFVASTNHALYAFDAAGVTGCSGTQTTCTPLWTATTGGAIESSPAVAGGVVYIGSDDAKLYAFDAAGAAGCSGAPKTCTPLWTATTAGALVSSPAVAGGDVYVGSDDGKLYAFDAAGTIGCSGTPKTCAPAWTATTGGLVESSPAVSAGVVYVGSSDHSLYAFDAAGLTNCSGTPKACAPLWAGPTGGVVLSSPAISGGTVYVGSADKKLYAFDATGSTGCSGSPKTCAPLWTALTATTDLVISSPAVANGLVLIGSGSGDHQLYGFDAAGVTDCAGAPKACTPLWTADVGAGVRSSPAVAGGMLFTGTDASVVTALALPAAAPTGYVVGWGADDLGSTAVPPGLTGVTAVAAGGSHGLALESDGTVVAWGRNVEGQATVPAGLNGVKAIAANNLHSVALKYDGTVLDWGSTQSGKPNVPAGVSGISAIAAGGSHTLGLHWDGTVVSWNIDGAPMSDVPAGLSGVRSVAAGYGHSLALRTDGTVVAWGQDSYGEADVPAGLTGVTAIAAGGDQSLALKADGTVVAWGRNDQGQATPPSGLSGVAAMAGGSFDTLALKTDGTVVDWGGNSFGQRNVPLGLRGVIAVAAGGVFHLGLVADGTPKATGLPYHPLVPSRILDTRIGLGASGPLGPGASLAVQVAGQGGIPSTGVSSVVLNVTVTGPTGDSFLTAWPAGDAMPVASNLNFVPGQTVPNLVTVKLGSAGQVNLYNNRGSTQVIADVAGWYGTDVFGGGSGFTAVAPARILDTRVGVGAPSAKLGPGATLPLHVTGAGGVPAAGVSAVVLNVTVTEPTAESFLTAWPAGQTRPTASNLNFLAGQTSPNLVVVAVGDGGTVDLYNNLGSTHVVADVSGWFSLDGSGVGSGYTTLAPTRVLDTRTGLGAPASKLGPGSTVAVQIGGVAGIPAAGVSSVVLNVTATEPTAETFLTAWPAGQVRPLASNLNDVAGKTVPNLVVVKVGTGAKVDLYNNAGSTHLVADVAGWYGT